ncbi:uncharacterized protein LOC120844153 [Ixodes scapularis]|uniref:uncharacterized protein LOC120844153 n=1 Tax=Ixodes scapularis TaxID=6945 RepID=UPI001A9DEDB7|nr:uncharacterized protein LOC120844153 [Ixodes scapularis]
MSPAGAEAGPLPRPGRDASAVAGSAARARDSYRHKPCGVVAYSVGNGAGLVAAAQLRSFLGQLGMITLPFSSVNAKIQKSLSEDGTLLDEEFARGINKMLGELEWYCTALRNHKDVCGLPS